MENKRKFVLGVIVISIVTTMLADIPVPVDPKDAELEALLKKSEEQLQRVTVIAKKVDIMTTEVMEEMHEAMDSLVEQNEILTVEVYEVKAAMESVTNSAVPFVLDPILPDTAGGER